MKYFKQNYVYTCGPAALRMVLDSLGIVKPEKWLARELRTNKRFGTKHEMLPALCERLKLDFVVRRNQSAADIKRFLKRKYRVVVCHIPPKDSFGHFAVVRKVTADRIFVHDPYYGPDVSYSRKHFERLWHDTENNKGWLIAIKNS